MRNLVPTRALQRRSRRCLEIAFVAISAGIFLTLVGMALYTVPLTSKTSSAYTGFNLGRVALLVGGIGSLIAGALLVVRALTWRTENDLAKLTGEFLAQHLDERYTLIRNVSKRKLGYIDAVLVGPAGVLVFRIVDYQGHFLNEAGKWLKADKKGRWKPMWGNPTREATADVTSLRTYLAAHKLPDIPIFGIVVFTPNDPIARLTLKDPVMPATHLTSLPTRLQKNYLAKERIDPRVVTAIVRLLVDD